MAGRRTYPMRRSSGDPLDLRVVRNPRSRTGGSSRPVRTCIGCRERAIRTELVRIVAIPRGTTFVLEPDLVGSARGRGAHLHPTVECFESAVRRKTFGRALRLAAPYDVSAVRAYLEAAKP